MKALSKVNKTVFVIGFLVQVAGLIVSALNKNWVQAAVFATLGIATSAHLKRRLVD